jgi:peptidyl-prolyl cis-trans isomerase C
MTNTPHAPLVTAFMLVTLSACSQEGSTASSTSDLGPSQVAVVNGQPVAESVLRVYVLATERKNLDEMTPEERARVIDDIIGLQLLAQQADKDGLTRSRTLAAQLELQRLRLVANAKATDYVEKNPPTDADIQAIYDENMERLSGQQYKARHILVANRDEAESVIAQLRQGSDFVALAQARADGPTGPNGGALDWFTLESMPPPFAEAVRAMTVGAYSAEPVETEFGFHVILLEDTRKQDPPALADIRNDLVSAAQRKRLDDYIKSLRDEASVTLEP